MEVVGVRTVTEAILAVRRHAGARHVMRDGGAAPGVAPAPRGLVRRVRFPRGRPRVSEPLIGALALVAPGTPLREGLDRVLQAHGAR